MCKLNIVVLVELHAEKKRELHCHLYAVNRRRNYLSKPNCSRKKNRVWLPSSLISLKCLRLKASDIGQRLAIIIKLAFTSDQLEMFICEQDVLSAVTKNAGMIHHNHV